MARNTLAIGLLALLPSIAGAADGVLFEFSGKLAGEARGYQQDGQFDGQDYRSGLSLVLEPELFWEWNDGGDSLTFKPFYRYDQRDAERSHGDIRELSWLHVGESWELRTGLRKVFWGVTEFQHLVDVINQTDAVEDIDGEDKLGQPMVNLSLVRDWGIVDLFVLPGFRERTFAGVDGRLRAGLVVDADAAEYQSAAAEHHIDTALRWGHSLGIYDLGLHWFHGTNREPLLAPRVAAGETVLVPVYEQIDQVGLDAQATIDSWLWKLETLWRRSDREQYSALQGGVEYTFYGIRDSATDLGVLLEYGWDERGEKASATFQNDLSFGARVTLNDAASTEFLAGVGVDLDYDSNSLFVEASRRFGDSWKVSLDGRVFDANDPADPLASVNQDDMIQLTVERYF